MSKDMLGICIRKLVTFPTELLGIVCDLLEKLADPEWVQATKRFLRKENPWSEIATTQKIYSFLKPLGQVEVKQWAASPNPHQFFQTNDCCCVWDGFKDLVLKHVEQVSNIPAMTLSKFQNTKNAYDREIRGELPTGHLFSDPSLLCALIAGFIQQQSNGRSGTLLNDGCASLFYVKVDGKTVVVRVSWRVDCHWWDVNAYRLDVDRWYAGRQVLSATAT